MSHIVESYPQTRLHGGLSKLHSADDDAVAWLTSYGSQNAYDNNNWVVCSMRKSVKKNSCTVCSHVQLVLMAEACTCVVCL